MNVLPEIERERLERAISAARIVGGSLWLAVGPFVLNIGLGFVLTFGVMLIAYGLVALRFDRTSGSLRSERRFAQMVTAADASFALLALLLFSSDPAWTVAPVMMQLVIIAAFRLGAGGAYAAAASNTVGYLAGTWLRVVAYGYPLGIPDVALLIGFSWMTAVLLAGILRESRALRQARQDLYEPLLAAQSQLGELIVVSEGGLPAYVSDAVAELTGYTVSELKRLPVSALFSTIVTAEAAPVETDAVGVARHFEASLARRDGATAHVEVSATHLPPTGGLQRSLFIARDITERKVAQAELERLAIHDGLTGLPNKALLRDRLERTILASTDESPMVAVLYINIDRFKDYNDAFGHAGGDELLAGIASRLLETLGPGDTLARYEGDEFVAVLGGAEQAADRAEELLRRLAEGIVVRGRTVHPQATVGISLAPQHGHEAETLVRRAEAAMYTAKRMSMPIGHYAPADDNNGGERIALLNDLRHALEHGELRLAYQPIIAMSTGECVSVESLVRWQHPTRGAVPPMDFIPLAEESGLIRQIGLWVLGEATRTCASWRGGPGVSVNLSMRNLQMPGLGAAIASALEMWRIPRGALTVEITESLLMREPDRMIELLTELEEIGVRASVDDYGTGYSSLAYLKRLPVREVKIDRAFVADMATNAHSETIVRSTIDLAHDLGLLVVAEGIEDQATWDTLWALGCDRAQGYFIARPMPAEEVRAWLRDRPSAGPADRGARPHAVAQPGRISA